MNDVQVRSGDWYPAPPPCNSCLEVLMVGVQHPWQKLTCLSMILQDKWSLLPSGILSRNPWWWWRQWWWCGKMKITMRMVMMELISFNKNKPLWICSSRIFISPKQTLQLSASDFFQFIPHIKTTNFMSSPLFTPNKSNKTKWVKLQVRHKDNSQVHKQTANVASMIPLDNMQEKRVFSISTKTMPINETMTKKKLLCQKLHFRNTELQKYWLWWRLWQVHDTSSNIYQLIHFLITNSQIER